MKKLFIFTGLFASIVLLAVILGIVNTATWFGGRAVEVAKQEIDPEVLLKKYEWFKDASAALDAKKAGLDIYKNRLARYHKLEEEGKLDRTAREQAMIWEQEYSGLKLNYNELAAEYNAEMAKINWRFCNVGELPKGANQLLPREYREYVDE
jgi:hypothetical protein